MTPDSVVVKARNLLIEALELLEGTEYAELWLAEDLRCAMETLSRDLERDGLVA